MTATDHVVCLNGHVCCSGSPIDVAKNNEYKTLFGEQASQSFQFMSINMITSILMKAG